jgi:hypothetical protein
MIRDAFLKSLLLPTEYVLYLLYEKNCTVLDEYIERATSTRP